MEKIKIAIVDSGIDLKHPKFKNLEENVVCWNILNQTKSAEDQDLGNGKGHGTGIFSIIYDHLHDNLQDFTFYIVKIFDELGHTSEDYLIKAIEYCIDNKVHIINLSLGIEKKSPSKELHDVCERAYKQGIIIIASASDNAVATYPAYFPFVFGVTGGIISLKKDYGIIENSPIQFIGKGNLQRVADYNSNYAFVAGNSQATAHITGIVSSIKRGNIDWSFHKIEKHLFENGKKDIRVFTNRFMQYVDPKGWIGYRIKPSNEEKIKILEKFFSFKHRFSWMKKIAIYPVSNKEMKAFFYFADLCPFEIVEVYDFPRFGARDKNIEINDTNLEINWDLNENSFNDVDTLVIGHPYDTAIELNTKFADKIINKCVEKKMNFFVFDKLLYLELKNKLKDYPATIYYPNDFTTLMDLTKLLNFDSITIPSLSVVGVTPQSGKFTTQLTIKKVLEKEGYSIGWLSTEPQGELFGADLCLPIGGEINSLTLGSWPYFLSSMISGIEKYKKPDIFLTGHQSGLVQQYKQHFQIDTLNSINFLASAQPDAVVCAINPAYAADQLERVVIILKNLFQLPILFFTLSKRSISPQKMNSESIHLKNEMLDENEWKRLADEISNKYGLPVIDPLDESQNHIIVERITNFFKAND
ncbi:MAG: S8 family serine peptidase [Bacteroidales bacterium]|nr:S8 family serine peptidase [Bacteroidales bacterium]